MGVTTDCIPQLQPMRIDLVHVYEAPRTVPSKREHRMCHLLVAVVLAVTIIVVMQISSNFREFLCCELIGTT